MEDFSGVYVGCLAVEASDGTCGAWDGCLSVCDDGVC